MATARVIPFEDNTPAQTITIDSTFTPSTTGCFVQAGQSVIFTNNSGVTIDIRFTPNPVTQTVFNDITALSSTAPNNTNTQQPLIPNGTANYYVYVGGVKQADGPYAIQAGIGPMVVQITNTANGPVCTPDTIAIPHNAVSLGGGTLQMNPYPSTDQYSVSWAGGNASFNPPLTSADAKPHTNVSPLGTYPFIVVKVSPTLGGGGGGTVKIKGT